MESNSTTYITLREMWRIFRKNWILIVLISLVAAILVGVLYAAIYSPVYSSSSQYYVSNVSDNTPLYSSGQTTGAMEMAAYCAQFLQGSVVLEKALEVAELTEQERATLTVERLRRMIKANVYDGSALIEVTVFGPDASLNYRLLQAIEKVFPTYCDIFNNQNNQVTAPPEGGSFMLKVTDRGVQDKSPDNWGTLIQYPVITFLIVLVITYVCFFIVYMLDTSIYSRNDLKEKLPDVSVFGVIPYWDVTASAASRKKKTSKRRKKEERGFAKERLILRENTPRHISEAFRQLSTNVTFCSSGEKGCMIASVSANAASGKSFVMANLAVSLSQRIDKKILLVDADMRCPMLHQIFGLENTVGLSQLLTGQAEDASAAYHTIGDGALTVLTSGKLPPNPLELLSAPKMEQMIEAWKQEYDYVLFDLPPVGEVADAIAMSKYVSGFLFVLRSGVSDIHRVRDAITLLEERNAKIHGCVLTDVESEFMSYYYTYGSKRNKTIYA